jgi:hypothetical protein
MDAVYQLKITLKRISPPIWRRVLVPATMPLDRLHDLIQAAMGWEDAHLHEFSHVAAGQRRRYVPADAMMELETGTELDERSAQVQDVLAEPKAKLSYVYDFGDHWLHEIVLEKILKADPGTPLPTCVKGKNACPPEDCGGFTGYELILEMILDPDDENAEEYADLLEWLDEDFDPEAFDLEETNRTIRAMDWDADRDADPEH